MIYTGEHLLPGSSLGSLSGSLDPSTTGVYDYTAPPSLVLAPRSFYSIVVTAGTPIANGAYEWSYGGVYNTSDGWIASFPGGPGSFNSADGSSWDQSGPGGLHFAINATPVPEPGVLGFFVLGGLSLIWPRRKAKGLWE
jgi:hypothetical protein